MTRPAACEGPHSMPQLTLCALPPSRILHSENMRSSLRHLLPLLPASSRVVGQQAPAFGLALENAQRSASQLLPVAGFSGCAVPMPSKKEDTSTSSQQAAGPSTPGVAVLREKLAQGKQLLVGGCVMGRASFRATAAGFGRQHGSGAVGGKRCACPQERAQPLLPLQGPTSQTSSQAAT